MRPWARAKLPARLGRRSPQKPTAQREAHCVKAREVATQVALVGLVVFSAGATGCVKSIAGLYPPAPADLVKPIYVINHGWHTGIALRRADLPEGVWPELPDLADSEYVEVGWGNREFYMAPEGTLGLALKAVLWPTPSVLHVVGFDGAVQEFFRQREIVEILVSDRGFQRLAAFIGDAYAKDGSGRGMMLGRGQYANSRFYAAREKYSLLKTCNTWTARALRSAGLPITSLYAASAGNVMEQARPLGRRVAVLGRQAQVLAQPLGRARDVGDRPLVDDAARGQHVDVVRDGEGEAHVLFDEQNRVTVGAQAAQDLLELRHDDGRQPFRRLVHQDEPRVRHERAADRQHLLLAARQVPGALAGALGQVGELAQHPFERPALAAGPRARAASRQHAHRQQEVLADREGREGAPALRDEPDAALGDGMGPEPVHRHPVEGDRPRARRREPGDRADQRRLAHPVPPEERHDLAARQGERQALEHVGVAVVGVDVVDGEERRVRRGFARVRGRGLWVRRGQGRPRGPGRRPARGRAGPRGSRAPGAAR